MKPIDYFLLFEESKNEYIKASEKKDFLFKLKSIIKICDNFSKILEKNYHTKLFDLFEKILNNNLESKEKFSELVKTRELIVHNNKYIIMTRELCTRILDKIPFYIKFFKEIETEEEKSLIYDRLSLPKKLNYLHELNQLENEAKGHGFELIFDLFDNLSKDILPCYLHATEIIQFHARDSYFLKEEVIIN